MLVVRAEQADAFRQANLVAFESEMVTHSRNFSPRLCKLVGDEQLHSVIRQAIERASGYGLTNRGPIRLFIELLFVLGNAFDTDPQYPWAAEVMHASDDQMDRAERLYEGAIEYQHEVSGPEDVNTHKALRDLLGIVREPSVAASGDFAADMLEALMRLFPLKAEYVGEEPLLALIREGRDEARKGLLPAGQGEALLVMLMFMLGHGCTEDPFYPWIANTLKDNKITDPVARFKQLENSAATWIEQLPASSSEGI